MVKVAVDEKRKNLKIKFASMLKSKLINNKKAAIQEAAAIKLDGMKKWEHTHKILEHNTKNFNEVISGARMSQPFSNNSYANYMNFRQSDNY